MDNLDLSRLVRDQSRNMVYFPVVWKKPGAPGDFGKVERWRAKGWSNKLGIHRHIRQCRSISMWEKRNHATLVDGLPIGGASAQPDTQDRLATAFDPAAFNGADKSLCHKA